MITKSLVRQLIDAAYESGYYSGKGEGGEAHHVGAVERRNKLRNQIFRILDKEEA